MKVLATQLHRTNGRAAPRQRRTTGSSLVVFRSTKVEPPEPRSGVILILILALIAVGAWLFFTSLFAQRSGISTLLNSVPASIAPASPAPSSIAANAVLQPVIIHRPLVNTENDTDGIEPVAETATEIQPEQTATTAAATNTDAANADAADQRAPIDTSHAAAQILAEHLPMLEPTATAFTPAPTVGAAHTTPDPILARPPIVGTDNTFAPDSTPVVVASISAVAPPQETPNTKPAHRASGLVVIVNKANFSAFTRADISNIYRDRITRWPSGERILVLNLPLDNGERQRFSTEILDMSPLDAATEWSNRTITNRAQNEYRTKNADVVVSYIQHHPNAIGYVPAAAISDADSVRVVFSIP